MAKQNHARGYKHMIVALLKPHTCTNLIHFIRFNMFVASFNSGCTRANARYSSLTRGGEKLIALDAIRLEEIADRTLRATLP